MTNSDDQLSVNQIQSTNSPLSNPARQRSKSNATDPRQLRRDASPSSHVWICAEHTEWALGSLQWPIHRKDGKARHTELAPAHAGRRRRVHDDRRSHTPYDRILRLIHGTYYEDISDGLATRARAAGKDDAMSGLHTTLRRAHYANPGSRTLSLSPSLHVSFSNRIQVPL
jgi:hypothetical protein